LARIDLDEGQPRPVERLFEATMVCSCGFENHTDLFLTDPLDQGLVASFVIGEAPAGAVAQAKSVESIF